MKLYSYVVRWDHGFAPNPFFGLCSLATCKPGIRKGAKIGDWVLGTGSAGTGKQGRAVFAMKVGEITRFDEYWSEARFQPKRPVLSGSYKRRFGDNIYHRDAQGQWIQEDSRHSQHGAVVNQRNLKRDTGTTDKVLLGTEFIYWGDKAPVLPDHLAHMAIGRPSYQCNYSDDDVGAFVDWMVGFNQKGRVGDPIDWQSANRW